MRFNNAAAPAPDPGRGDSASHIDNDKEFLCPPVREHEKRTALVTVTYNSAEVLPDFLASLDLQTDNSWGLIVIDNSSTDCSVELVRSWGGRLEALVVNGQNQGFAAATNQGILLAREKGFHSVLIINNDTAFPQSFLSELLRWEHRDTMPVITPTIHYADDTGRFWYAGGGFTWFRGAFQAFMSEKIPQGDAPVWRADFASGCCLLVDMTVFDAIGMLDERFFVYWEDVDFCWRCKVAGIPVHVLRAPVIFHKASSLTGGNTSAFTIRMFHRGQVRFIKKTFGTFICSLQIPLMLVKALGRLMAGKDDVSRTRLRWQAIASEAAGND